MREVLTIGHSSLSYERFVSLLREARVTAVADVRSSPFSRRFPQFNKGDLQKQLRKDGLSYAFLGKELGGRPVSQDLFNEGVADYERMAATPSFAKGLERIIEGAKEHRIALMCSEANPLECHRCLLVGRSLETYGISVKHILASGRTASQADIEQELLELFGKGSADLFAPVDEQLGSAYRAQARRVAFAQVELLSTGGS